VGIRALTAADEPELERFALMAAFAPHSPLPEGAEAMAIVRRWLEGWSELDPGVCWEQQGELGAAAWARSVEPVIARSAAGEPLLEVVLAVVARLRGRPSVGRFKALIATVRDAGEPGLCPNGDPRARLRL